MPTVSPDAREVGIVLKVTSKRSDMRILMHP